MTGAGAHARTWISVLAALCLVVLAQAVTRVARGDPKPTTSATDPRRKHPRPPRALAERQVRDLTAFVRKYYPELTENLDRLLREDRPRAMRMLRRLNRMYLEVRRYPDDIAQAVIDRRKASVAIYRAIRQLGTTTTQADRDRLMRRLKELLARQFDLEQTFKEYQVAQLEQRVAKLAEDVKARRNKRDEIIAARIARLLKLPGAATKPATATATRPAGRPRRARRRLTDEQFEQVLTFARRHLPELQQKLLGLRKTNTPKTRRMLVSVHGLVVKMQAMPANVRKAAVAVHRTNIGLIEKAAEARKATDVAERDRLIRSMRQLLGEQFRHGLIVREYEVTQLRRELTSLRSDVRQHARRREAIIAERLENLIRSRSAPATRPTRR